jgi:hypothetical protein
MGLFHCPTLLGLDADAMKTQVAEPCEQKCMHCMNDGIAVNLQQLFGHIT